MKLPAHELSQILTALHAAERQQAPGDRRRHCRITLHAFGVSIFELTSARRYTAVMRDISVNGVSLLQSWAPALGSQLIVTFVGKKQAQTEIRCEVSYVSEQANKLFAVGCIFLQIESNTPAPSTPPAPAK